MDDNKFASSNLYNNERALMDFKARRYKAGDNTLSQIHHNSTLQKGKAIALSSAEIKIVRTDAKTPGGEFSLDVISYLIELLLQYVMWNYPQPTGGHGLVPTPSPTQMVPALA